MLAGLWLSRFNLLGMDTNSFRHRLGGHKTVLEAGKNTRLDLIVSDAMAILTRTTPMMVEAGIAVRDDDVEHHSLQPFLRHKGIAAFFLFFLSWLLIEIRSRTIIIGRYSPDLPSFPVVFHAVVRTLVLKQAGMKR
ncbi:hypothetical protein PMI03_04790 [Rhizobium sp. AP16]|nr:hypothetical protein PMI03_04790 [Rhizobium sp. AP16]